MKLETVCKQNGVGERLIPVPREISAGCGMAWCADPADEEKLYELMEKELANIDLDITRITEMMKISRTKFYYKVKGLTGENPSVFFKRYKLNRAADLLKEGKYNMSEIAYMTGFNTLSHFSTSFKKQFGVPPSEYVG